MLVIATAVCGTVKWGFDQIHLPSISSSDNEKIKLSKTTLTLMDKIIPDPIELQNGDGVPFNVTLKVNKKFDSEKAKNIMDYLNMFRIFDEKKNELQNEETLKVGQSNITGQQLKKVAKLGPKAFEQCAGFLRVAESKNVLDNTAVHPESYSAATELLTLCGVSENDVKSGNITALTKRVETDGTSALAEKLGIGEPTLKDIVSELAKPGRDPRDELPQPLLRSDVMSIEDLKAGMELKGTVRNVIDFGAFVDVGVHQDGLVHISQITNRFIKHPSEILKVGDIVTVWVIEADSKRNRISLTMKNPNK